MVRNIGRLLILSFSIIGIFTLTAPSAKADDLYHCLYFSDCSSGFEQEFADEWGNGIMSSLLEAGTYCLSVEPFGGALLTPFTLHVEFVNDRNR
jgi:hypothetical protein